MSKLRLRKTEKAHSKQALGQRLLITKDGSVLGNRWVSPYLLLGQQHLGGEELQALTSKVVAQLLQAIHSQCLGARGQ